jgi:phytoene dehydrogenase-like protein
MWSKRITRREFLGVSAMAAASTALCCTSLNISKKLEALRDKKKYPSQYPTVVIGAGLGGLTCAVFLARAGFPVTVLEQHDVPGGYATSFKRGDYDFEVSLHATSVKNNAIHDMYRDLGLLEKIELVELERSHRVLSPEYDIILPDCDPDAYVDLLSSKFPQERKGIKGFVGEIIGIHNETYKLYRTIREKGDFVRATFPLQYPKMWNVRSKTLAQLLDDHVKDRRVRGILSYLWGYYGLPPSRLSGFLYATATGDYLKNGSYYIKSRSQSLSNALADIIRESGSVLLGTSAESIIARGGVVSGVRTADGKIIPARIVVSNANVPDTFNRMLSTDLDCSDYLKKLSGYRPSISAFNVWLGLKGELRGKIPGCCIHVSTGDDSDTSYGNALKGDFGKNGFGVAVYDNYFKGYSIPGRSTVSIIQLSGYEPWRSFERDYFAGRKREYLRVKDRIAKELIHRAEKYVIPDLSSMIEVVESSTPLTNLRYTRNPEGAIYGYEQSMDNSFMNRIENNTPVKGLYLASAWGNPGGGYSGVMRCGANTFKRIVDEL